MDRKVGKTGNEADKKVLLPNCRSHLQHSDFFYLFFIFAFYSAFSDFFPHVVSTLHPAVSLFSLLPFLEESLTHTCLKFIGLTLALRRWQLFTHSLGSGSSLSRCLDAAEGA